MLRWFIAKRYISSRFITLAAFLLISLSVAILIILLAVMEGFRVEMVERIRGTSADLKIESTRFIGMDEHPRVRDAVDGVPGVRGIVPYVETLAMFRLPRRETDQISGHLNLACLDLAEEARLGKLDTYIQNYRREEERFPLPERVEEIIGDRWLSSIKSIREIPADEELPPVLIGALTLPYLVYVRPGWAIGQQLEFTSISPVDPTEPARQRFLIAGFFRSLDAQTDSETVLMDLDDAIDFLKLRNPETGQTSISGFRVFIEADEEADVVKARLEERLSSADIPFVRVRTWREEKEKILSAVRMEKTLVGFVLGVIVVFVGLMIFIILTVQIVEKTRDLGILQAVGLPPSGVVGIYMRMGLTICLAGILLGVAVGLLFSGGLNTIERWAYLLFGFEVFPKDVYYIEQIPVRYVITDFVYVIVPTVLVSFLASVVSAVRASRKDPMLSIRAE